MTKNRKSGKKFEKDNVMESNDDVTTLEPKKNLVINYFQEKSEKDRVEQICPSPPPLPCKIECSNSPCKIGITSKMLVKEKKKKSKKRKKKRKK